MFPGLRAIIIRLKTVIAVFSVMILFFTSPDCCSSFTVQEEQELGDKLLYSVRKSFPLLDTPDIHQYINGLGKEVLDVAGIQYFTYHFFVINSKQFNAFAAPSGLIFFYSGLISAMNSEDELVSVLAHEIAHVSRRHIAQQAEKGKVSTLATTTLALAGFLVGGPLVPALLTGALAAGQSIRLSYSRAHEEEADLLAYDWLKALNRDPSGQLRMLNTMRRIARYRSEKPPQYLLTHPNPEARIDYVESLLYMDRQKNELDIKKRDDFDFFRFKYRVLSEVKDISSFKNDMANQFASRRSSEDRKKLAQYGLALISMRENDFRRSLELINKVIDNFPDKLVLIGDRGYIHLEAGNLIEAEKDLKQVLKTNRNDLFATFNLGRLMARKGRYIEAENYFKTVSYAIPEYSRVYYELGRIAAVNGKHGTASYYLGKYNLYRGRLKLADFNFRNALKSESLSLTHKKECEEFLETIENIQD